MEHQPGTGSVQTIEDLLRQILGAVMNQVIPAGGNMASGLLTPMLRRALGNDIAWDMPITANTTAEGIYRHQMNRRVYNMQQDLSRDIQQTVTESLVRDWERTKNSFEDWQLSHPRGTRGEYDAYIDTKTRNSMDSGMYKTMAGWINNALDLNGGAGVGEALGQAAANFARQGVIRNDPNALLYGRAMVENLLLDPETRTVRVGSRDTVVPVRDANGNVRMAFDRDNWSGMNQKSVADLAAALSRETDFLKGIDPSNTEQLKSASGKFKEMVREYATALSPLKDVFGDDTASMIASLERMTGQGLSKMGAMRASAMAVQLADRYNSGMYGTQFLTSNVRTMQGLVDQAEGLSSIHYLNSLNMGVRGSDMARGAGTTPAYMSRERWDREAMKLAFQTSISPAAENMALDYSIWAKHRERAGIKQNSWEDFQNALSSYMDEHPGMDVRSATGQLSGALSRAEKEEGRAYNYFDWAVTNGYAADMAAEGELNKRRLIAARAMNMDVGIQRIIDNVAATAAKEGVPMRLTRSGFIQRTMDVLENRPDLYGIKDQKKLREEIGSLVDNENNLVYTDAEADVISSIMFKMFNDTEDSATQSYLNTAQAVVGRRETRKYADEAARRRDRYATLQSDLLRPGSQLVGDLLHGGFSIDAIRERLGAGGYIESVNGSYADKDNLAAVLSAANMMAAKRYAKGDEEDIAQARSGYISRFYGYANSTEGLKSTTFQENLRKYQAALEAGDSAGVQSALLRLDAELKFGSDAIKQFEQDKLYTKDGAIILTDDKFSELAGKSSTDLALMHMDSAIYGLATYAKEGVTDQDVSVNKVAQQIWKETREEIPNLGENIKDVWTRKRDSLTRDARKELDKYKRKLAKAEQSGDADDITKAQAAYDRAEQQYHDSMAAVDKIDQQLGMAKRDMESAPGASDKLDLVTVLNKLNNTLDRFRTDASGNVYMVKNKSTSTQDNS